MGCESCRWKGPVTCEKLDFLMLNDIACLICRLKPLKCGASVEYKRLRCFRYDKA